MLNVCRQFLTDRLQELQLLDGTAPYSEANIFFDEISLDFLKENAYAVACLPLIDRTKANGKLIGKVRALSPAPEYTLTRRRYAREIMFRCLFYARTADDLYGTVDFTGLAEQFTLSVAGHKVIPDDGNNVIRIGYQDTVRPWDSGTELERKLRRPRLAIARVQFAGGVQTAAKMPIINGIEFTPVIGPARQFDDGQAMLFDDGSAVSP